MRKENFELFKQYLMKHGYGSVPKYEESVANERVNCCKKIEKRFNIVLEDAAADIKKRSALLEQVADMPLKSVRKYELALLAYFTYLDAGAGQYIPIDGGYFYKLKEDVLPDIYFDMQGDLERHYEVIVHYGRTLFGNMLSQQDAARIPVVLSPIVKEHTYKADDHYRSRKIAKLAQERGGDISQEEVLKIMRQKTFTEKVAGEFCEGGGQFGPHIMLYYNVIDGDTKEEKVAAFAKVLAHEYMHYMEYRYCRSLGVKYYQNKKLSEAMADFFGVLYCIYANSRSPEAALLKPAFTRYQAWQDFFGSNWPYANALYFYTVHGDTMDYSEDYDDYRGHGSVEKLVYIFSICQDADVAYKALIK